MNQPHNTSTIDSLPFLLEIGSEEIPARFVPDAMRDLASSIEKMLHDELLGFQSIRTVATPRRMAVMVVGLVCKQPDRDLAIKGPPVSVAFDAEGNPTKAAEGFARKNGVNIDDCTRMSDDRGEYLLVQKKEVGLTANEVLQQQLPGIITKISLRKVMRWGSSSFEYARPLQWLVALHGEQEISFQVGGISAGRITRGHRTLAQDQAFEISHPAVYEELLREHQVIVDHQSRRELITAGAQQVLSKLSTPGKWLIDEELLTEVVFLCEHPTVFIGKYEEEYFELPDEVIVTALKAHQRYFAVGKQDGSGLLPYFIAVRDGGEDFLGQVIDGNQRVLRARLADALFYWRFDQKQSPDQHTASLVNVTWIDGFGSVLDKTKRLQRLVVSLWENGLGGGQAIPKRMVRAATICKSDLVSEMIKDGKEFTKLEGLIGARYAAQAGENDEVCRAIERFYYPRSAGGQLPGDRVSSVLSAAERLDTIAGCWLAGFVPTGAKDPYALRRHSLALLRLIFDLEARVDLNELLQLALKNYSDQVSDDKLTIAQKELFEFVGTRLERYLVDTQGNSLEVVRAVLPAHGNDPTDVIAWIKALKSFRDRQDFLLLATGFKRCKNIIKDQLIPVAERAASLERWAAGGSGSLGESFTILEEDAEKVLLAEIVAAIPCLKQAKNDGSYDDIFRQLSGFGPAIDRFFDTVRVNVDQQSLQNARQAFLREVHALFASYAEFSEVAPLD